MLRKSLEKKLPKFLLQGKKIGRPVNLIFFIKNLYSRDFVKIIKKIELDDFNKNKILSNFKEDIKTNNNDNFPFYFRILNYAYWKKMFIN